MEKIKFTVDTSNPAHVRAMAAFTDSLFKNRFGMPLGLVNVVDEALPDNAPSPEHNESNLELIAKRIVLEHGPDYLRKHFADLLADMETFYQEENDKRNNAYVREFRKGGPKSVTEIEAKVTGEGSGFIAEHKKAVTEMVEKTKKKSKRRTSAQVALDKQIKANGYPPRLDGESVEDYHERTADEHGPGNVEGPAEGPTPNENETPTKDESTPETTAPGGDVESTDSPEELTQEVLTDFVLAATEPKGTPEGDARRAKIRAFLATRSDKDGKPVGRIGNLKKEDYQAVYDFTAALPK